MGNDLRSYLDSDSLYVAYAAALALGDRRSDDLRAAWMGLRVAMIEARTGQ